MLKKVFVKYILFLGEGLKEEDEVIEGEDEIQGLEILFFKIFMPLSLNDKGIKFTIVHHYVL